VTGIEQAPDAFMGMLEGRNFWEAFLGPVWRISRIKRLVDSIHEGMSLNRNPMRAKSAPPQARKTAKK